MQNSSAQISANSKFYDITTVLTKTFNVDENFNRIDRFTRSHDDGISRTCASSLVCAMLPLPVELVSWEDIIIITGTY